MNEEETNQHKEEPAAKPASRMSKIGTALGWASSAMLGVCIVGGTYYAASSYLAYRNDFIPNYELPIERELASARKLNSFLSDSPAREVNNNYYEFLEIYTHSVYYEFLEIYTHSVSINWLVNGPAKMSEYGQDALISAKNAHQSAAEDINREFALMKGFSGKPDLSFLKPGIAMTATGYPKLDLPVKKVQPKPLGNQNKGNPQNKIVRVSIF